MTAGGIPKCPEVIPYCRTRFMFQVLYGDITILKVFIVFIVFIIADHNYTNAWATYVCYCTVLYCIAGTNNIILSTCPLHTISGCGKEGRVLIGPW